MLKFLIILVAIFTFTGCRSQTPDSITAKKSDTIPVPLSTDSLLLNQNVTDSAFVPKFSGKVVTGKASFYSSKLNGSKTATGDVFHNSKFTAASNSFKLYTWVKVTNMRNNKTAFVLINDRMGRKMAKRGRVIDVSRCAAELLDFVRDGLTKVKVEALTNDSVKPNITDKQ